MRSKTLIVLIAVAIMGVSSTAMAKGGGGAGGKGGSTVGHGHFFGRPHSFNHRFQRNQFLLGDWGWGLGGYGDNGYSNTNVVIYPQATPQFATGAIAATPCLWNEETFKVPSLIGGTQPVSVVSCR